MLSSSPRAAPCALKNDFVLALIGYHPDYDFLRSTGIELSERSVPSGLRPRTPSKAMFLASMWQA